MAFRSISIFTLLLFSSCKIADFYNGNNSEIKKIKALKVMEGVKKSYSYSNWDLANSSRMNIEHFWQPVLGVFSPLKSGKSEFIFEISYLNSFTNQLVMYEFNKDTLGIYEAPHQNLKKEETALLTLAYFVDLPMFIQQAELFYFQDSVQLNNHIYYKVLATWGSLSANKKYDQFVLWINKANHLIERVDFTTRNTRKSQKIRMEITQHHISNNIPYFQKISFYPLNRNKLWRQITIVKRSYSF